MARKAPPTKTLQRKPEPPRPASKESKSKKPVPPSKPVVAAKAAKPVKEAKAKEGKKEAKPSAVKGAAVKSATAKPAGAKGAVAAKDAPPKKKRSKSGGVRLKAYWGVFNQMMKRVSLFEYAERKQADKKAAELGAGGKTPHFVQLVKEVIRDAD